MRKIILAALAVTVLLGGCGQAQSVDLDNYVTKEEYDKVVEERDSYKSEKEKLDSDLEALNNEKQLLQDEYSNYKETMSQYEGLEKAESEARAIEAQKIIDAEKAEKERLEAEEKAKQEEKEKVGYETGISYENLARTPDDYEGEKVKFTGKVVQVIEGTDTVQIRFAANSDYDNMIFCEYYKNIVDSRILEGDIITIYGISCGLLSYESTMGGMITIPSVAIDKIDQ